MRLASFSPTSGYPPLDLDRQVYFPRVVHDGVHAFAHHDLQPSLRVLRLFCAALDDHLVVAEEYRRSPGTLAFVLLREVV